MYLKELNVAKVQQYKAMSNLVFGGKFTYKGNTKLMSNFCCIRHLDLTRQYFSCITLAQSYMNYSLFNVIIDYISL